MKKFLVLFASFAFISLSNHLVAQGIFNKVKEKVKQRADNKTDNAIDKGLDKVEDATKKGDNNDNSNDNTTNTTTTTTTNNTNGKSKTDTPVADIKTYQNYDFVPGDKVLFEDNFTDDQDGEFPTHWELISGQSTLNKIKGEEAFYLTEGNYARVKPRMKTAKYLTDPFTVEFDYYHIPGAYGVITQLQFLNKECDCESSADLMVNESEVSFGGVVSLNKSYSPGLEGDNFNNKWHHVAIANKNHQLKVYVDQNRVLVVPDTKADFYSVSFAGIGDEKVPIIFKNVRIASGGNMNMIGKKFTDSKIVTHGINFDIDKATIKPESMGTLNMIAQVLKDNPEIKFQVGGHTDNTGTAAHNLTLSQQRADAVKDQLVKMGIDASRLTTKGFGDTKPISDNTTLEGKANNRRVEFVKM